MELDGNPTFRALREATLRSQQAILQATLESTADGILVTTSEGRVVMFNEKFLQIWDLPREVVAGALHADLVERVVHRFGDRQRLGRRIADIYASPAEESLDTLELQDSMVLERFSRPQVLDGEIVGRVWSYRDVTARQRIEEALRAEARALGQLAEERERLVDAERAARAEAERASRLKDEFLATLSHELRTPLTAMLGWAKVLLRKHDDPQTTIRGLEAIERNAAAQARLIDDLLDMNRIVSGKLRLEMQPTDLGEVAQAAVEAVRPSADAKELRLQLLVDPLAGPIQGDPARLQQVVWNLLTNAVKFTPPGGSIELTLRRLDTGLELQVADSGVGISPQFLPHVFDRFRQGDASTTRRHGGLGLGLSIARQLVELHGGSITAASGGEGRGARFSVRLPLAQARTPAVLRSEATGAAGPLASVSLQGLTLLLVDDEADGRELVAQVLRDSGATVHQAASAQEALAMLEQLRPALLISDIGMPGCDGFELVRRLRQRPPEAGGRIPAIALTAFARSEDRAQAMLAGYQMHLAKPVEPHELVATVAAVAALTAPA
jgi:PAS domain S-box-containing protein